MATKSRLLLVVPFILVPIIGCGSSKSAPANVSGKVTLKKKNGEIVPVEGGTVTFHASEAGTYPCPIKSDGTYSGTQMPVGEIQVTVETESVNPEKKAVAYGGGRSGGRRMTDTASMLSPRPAEGGGAAGPGKYTKIPKKYEKKDSAGITLTLSKGNQTHNIELSE